MGRILIILKERNLYLYQEEDLLNSFPVAIGKPATPTPTGKFRIMTKIKEPYNPALGTRWMQFTHQMHGIHGTNNPPLIGQAVSNGCVRMHNHNAEYVYDRVEIGSSVTVKQTKQDKQKLSDFFYYRVKPNDTLYKIANRFAVSVARLVQLNELDNKELIFPGQKLKIPTS
jgi:LysM repeat protein